MKIKISQQQVTRNVDNNKKKITKVISESIKDEWIIFPEGMLSGYYPEDENYINNLNWEKLQESIEEIHRVVRKKGINCLFGTALFENENWYNSVIFLSKSGVKQIYRKVNLATLDRKCFKAGNELDVYEDGGVNFGIQLCR